MHLPHDRIRIVGAFIIARTNHHCIGNDRADGGSIDVSIPEPHVTLRARLGDEATESMSLARRFPTNTRSASKRLLVIGVACVSLALATYGTLRTVFGDRPAHINVRWAPIVAPDVQRQLEAKYHLASAQRTEGRTFSYELTDLSYDNIRGMVLDPAVEDTHYIHRTAYRIWRFAPRGRYPGSGAVWGPLLEVTIVLLVLVAGTTSLLACLEFVLPETIAARLPLTQTLLHPGSEAARLSRALGNRILPASPHQVALFRIVFGSGLLALILAQRVSETSVREMSNALTPLQAALVAPFVAAPHLVFWVLPWVIVWGVLFVIGAAARISFAMLTIGVLFWAALFSTRVSYHTVSALLVCLLCLCASRWSDVWSIDAWWRRRRGTPPSAFGAPREYGYTIWIPGVVLGVVFAAAAAAKLRESGIAWILNGTVKYHFLGDSRQAPVDWGLAVGLHPRLAVALSFGAVLIESGIVIGAFARTYRYRALAGCSAASILLGFGLFQGLFWPAWWLLLLSFLPWHRIVPGTAGAVTDLGASGSRLVPLQHLIVALLVGEQLVFSGLRLEEGPAFSTYGMYSNTYSSPADYEAQSATSYWLVSDDGRQCRVTEGDAKAFSRGRSAAAAPSASSTVRRCFGPTGSHRTELEERREKIDWSRWRLNGEVRRVIAASSEATDDR